MTHKKYYNSKFEEGYRRKVYLNNLQKIQQHNQKYKLNLVSYKLQMNKFGDMVNEK
jgi:cathepsin L